ncbi:MAG: xanthine dehydrogenase family protein molybdopterin-binding subunit [Candidatus Latescibacteria bacterium]|nr:xanthine dehydrogenase family protein molybdopterin-binding subunit [Candidatus Latescibacterota bacterium]
MEPNGQQFHVVGSRVPRVDALEKVTGRARYTADVHLPGLLYGVFVRSPYAHARITRIDVSKARALPGVMAVMTQQDLTEDQALVIQEEVHATRRVLNLFATDKVTYQGQKIAAIAAVSREIAEDAVRLVEVEYDPLPAYIDPRDAAKPETTMIYDDRQPVIGPHGETLHNVAGESHHQIGDVDQGFRDADRIFEDTYIVHRAHQTYIEPQSCIAEVGPDGKVTVWSSTQGHFAVRANISSSLGIPLSQINSIGMTIGGGFGAKFGGIIDTYAVLLAQKTRRPVKIVYTREEEFLDARPAPGAVITIKTGVTHDGTITARQAFALWDPGIGSGGCGATGRIQGVYSIPNVKWDAYDIHTNKPAPGAYRAPGAPQATFASESQLNRIAHELGIDPVELRLKNMREGDQVDFKATLKAVADHVGWWQREHDTGPNQGWGVAVGEWTNGAGPGAAVVSIHEDGSVSVFSGLMDITGTDSAMAVIAAEVLGVEYQRVKVIRGDTDSAPYATASGGSVITFSMGNAVLRAAEEARERILALAAEQFAVPVDRLELRDGQVVDRDHPENAMSLAEAARLGMRTIGGPIVGRGAFAAQPSATTIAAQIAKVEVNPDTGQVRLLKYVGSLDVGRAIYALGVEGQMEGGAVQGFSWGLMEQMQYAIDGRNANPNLLDYRIPTAMDVPYVESVLVEVPTKNGPFGCKGVGEPPIAPGIAVVAGAIHDAIGVWCNEAPITPERVVMACQERKDGVRG